MSGAMTTADRHLRGASAAHDTEIARFNTSRERTSATLAICAMAPAVDPGTSYVSLHQDRREICDRSVASGDGFRNGA